jgi:peptide deformylase
MPDMPMAGGQWVDVDRSQGTIMARSVKDQGRIKERTEKTQVNIMERRDFLKNTGLVTSGVLLAVATKTAEAVSKGVPQKREPRLLQISQLGNDVLRQAAQPVTEAHDSGIQELIDDMIATLEDAGGVGIAAPQVYRSVRIIIIASKPSPNRPDVPDMPPLPMINPEVTASSDNVETDWEGCLSIPGFRAPVPRYVWVDVTFGDREGKQVSTRFEGFVARIFQHEFDHLEGIVYLDRIRSVKEIYTEKEYQRLMKLRASPKK